MGALLIPLLIILAVAAVVVAGLVGISRRSQAVRDLAGRESVPTVRYELPTGHDPAAVVATLSRGGFEGIADPATGELVVPFRSPRARRRIERLIREAPRTLAS